MKTEDGQQGLCASGVCVISRDGDEIIADVHLVVNPGERLALIGPNGAGKTSLLRVLFGRLKPDQGRVLIGGRDLACVSPAERSRRIAVVSQGDAPDMRLTVLDYVGLGRIPHRGHASTVRHRAVVEAALDRAGLSALSHRPLETLSGGARQRAAIARAIAQEPSILILDEPTNHLDPRARADMLETASNLGVTVIAVLHDLALVSPFADRVAVMQNGRLIAHDIPAVALRPKVVRDVFGMDCFPFINPTTGRRLLVFDTPPTSHDRVPNL